MIVRYWKAVTFFSVLLASLCFGIFGIFVPGKEPEFDDFMKAHEAFNMGEYALATEILEPLALSGKQRAQTYMRDMEAFGLGRPINRGLARDWAARSGANDSRGNTECIIGISWATGQFGPQDIKESAYWVNYADRLRGVSFCLASLQGKRLPDALREQIARHRQVHD